MNFSEALSQAKHATRIVVFGPPVFSECLLHCLNFQGTDYHFFSAGKENTGVADYHIFQTEDTAEFIQIRPNITFIASSDFARESPENMLEHIIDGGVLIYNEENAAVKELLLTSGGFFRQLSYEDAHYKTENAQVFLETDFSQIPVHFGNAALKTNIAGLQILAQQVGVMEEEFYEALMEFFEGQEK